MADNHQKKDTKTAILAAAEKVFEEHGYSSTTIEAIALEASTAKGSVYNYFKSKEELFGQVVSKVIAVNEADVNKVMSTSKIASEKLLSAIDMWFDRLAYYSRIGRLMLEARAASAANDEHGSLIAAQFKGIYELMCRIVSTVIAEGIQSGEFSSTIDARQAAMLTVALLDGMQIECILNVGVTPDRNLLEVLKSGIVSSLRAGIIKQEPHKEG